LKGEIDDVRAALAEAIKRKPDIDSLARFGAQSPYTNPAYMALRAKTLYVGLRRAGLPEE
jgi:adenylate cyclase